jgi:trans-aconitate methyltransferase
LELVEILKVPHDAAVVDVGGGASLLVDALHSLGYTNLSVLDVSAAALAEVKDRLGPDASVSLLREDLLQWRPAVQFDLWHDRAVFHFLTDATDRASYLEVLRSGLLPGGAVIMATFAPDGPEYCSGLAVARYSADDLTEFLGPDFAVIEQRQEEHHTPTGAIQPFTWVAARRRGGNSE